MKKILTLLLAAALAGAMATSAAAVEEDAVLRSYQEPELMVEEEPITAEHSYITYGREGDGIVLNTTSQSDTVAIRIQGGTAATSESEGLSIENGVVTMSKELCDAILADGENDLHFVFEDGFIEVTIFVTNDTPAPGPGTDIPKTGDTTSAMAVTAVLLSSLAAAAFLSMKRRKAEQE